MLVAFKFNNILLLSLVALTLINSNSLSAQETNSQVSGKILSGNNEILSGATVTAIHQPTKNVFITQSHPDGYFHFFNLKPGGPYTITASFTGHETIKKDNLYFNLDQSDNSSDLNFNLAEKKITLTEVILKNSKSATNRTGMETNINEQKLAELPSISRNLQDYIRLVPQAKVSGDGMISLAGQNSRFNAFYIDGANNNDLYGLAQSGTNGGQTNAPPISMDAIEEIKVLLAPYNVQYSNFTGGSINAITRSGTNEFKGSAWYYFRNEKLAGRSPLPVEKPGTPGVFERPRLNHFVNQTKGIRLGGPLMKNKLFYFILAEKQQEVRPQTFNFSEYRGNSNREQLNAIAERLRNFYHYEPGSFLENQDKLIATQAMVKIDYNPSVKNKFSLTYRFSKPIRTASQMPAGSTLINFSNNGSVFSVKTHSAVFEWKSFLRHNVSNRLLVNFTKEIEERKWIGDPFPRVNIFDGAGSIAFGSPAIANINLYKASAINFSDILKFIKQRHTISTGIDFNFNNVYSVSLSPFGQYDFSTLNDFMRGIAPTRFQSGFSLLDTPKGYNTLAAIRVKPLESGVFINDDIHVNANFNVNLGLRFDGNLALTHPLENKFFNDTAISIISQYYNIEGARAGQEMKQYVQLSPRIGLTFKIPHENITISGGGGIFTEHLSNAWRGSVYTFNGGSITGRIDINPKDYGINFNPDPYKQPTPQSLGIDLSNAKGALYLFSRNFKYPTVFRSSLNIHKRFKSNWTVSLEGIFTQNVHEIKYTNINILPPTKTSSLPDARNVYSLKNVPDNIPLPLTNPYIIVMLMSNNHEKKGSSYSATFIIDKPFNNNFSFNAAYSFGRSSILFEASLNQVAGQGQWGQATVNGKNYPQLSVSDLDLHHRISANLVKKISFGKDHLATTLTLFYNGQIGLSLQLCIYRKYG